MADNEKKMPGIGDPEQKQKRLFKYKRAGVELSENEVREIKAGRKRLRADLRAAGLKSKKDFELTASSLGLYFDKRRFLAFLGWLLHGRHLLTLLATLLLLLTLFWIMSLVSQMRGHFTINVTEDLFDQGLAVGIELLEDGSGLANPSNYLFSIPLEDAPCTSISTIPGDIHELEGGHAHGEDYFSYTFYIRNEGDQIVGYDYTILINSESKGMSTATWVMMIRDGSMTIYAKGKADGTSEILPDYGTRSESGKLLGFREDKLQFMHLAAYPEQFIYIPESLSGAPFYRVAPIPFASDEIVATGREINVVPGEMHKYTIVLWLEGDDPDCTDDLIGGHLGLEMNFKLIDLDDLEE